MAMDTTFYKLACYLLALFFAVVQSENGTITPTISTPALNLTQTTAMKTPSNYTESVTVISNWTENTTPFNTPQDNTTFTKTTAATSESTSHVHTSQSTTIMTPLTNSTSQTTTMSGTHSTTFTAVTTPSMQTTGGYISTPDTTVITTANPLHTVNTTSNSMYTSAQGAVLNISERNMTILFSVVLGVFAMALVVFLFHRCKQKIQYMHQPLNNTDDDTDAFVADDDTLVISGGLYEGHPIYDNVPITAPADQSQFRLEFL